MGGDRQARLRWSCGALAAVLVSAALGAILSSGIDGLRWRFVLVLVGISGVLVGVVRNRPSRVRPWLLLLAGMVASAAGDVVVLLAARSGPLTANVPADAWLTVLAGVFFLVGLLDATRPFGAGDRGGALDALIATLAGGTLVWQLLVVPAAAPGWAGSGTELAGALQVAVQLGVLVLLARLTWLLPPRSRLAAATLTFGVLAAITAFLLGALQEAAGGVAYSGLRAATGAVANLSAAVAALHPSMRAITAYRPAQPDRVSLFRTVLLGLALAAPPAVLLVTAPRQAAVSVVSLAATWVVLVVAVLTRIHLLQRGWEAARDELARSEDLLVSLVAHTGDAVLLLTAPGDAEPSIQFASPACRRLTGRPPDEVRRSRLDALVVPDDAEDLRTLVVRAGPFPRQCDVRVVHVDGSARWVEAVVDRAPQEEERSVVLTLRDVDHRKRTELTLAEVASRDELTGLWNRRGVDALLGTALAGVDATGTDGPAVVLVDLDGFKQVNDLAGHAAGDEVLRVVAQRLLAAVREGDEVARFGGDEFLVVCEVDGPDTAALLADRILAVGEDPVHVDGRDHRVSVSVGVALARGEDDASGLLARADAALYRAKGEGKNRVRIARDVPAG